jgi:pimeloyl-ACP methyl ester carboxylesterase
MSELAATAQTAAASIATGQPFTEEIVQFGNEKGLVGILTAPKKQPADATAHPLPAVLLLNAGLLHRIGPNRIYVTIARALACAGFSVLRFDFSGLGDSAPRADHMPYAQSAPLEAELAMDFLTERLGVDRFLLMGHCAGAGFSLLVGSTAPRVVGAALINMEGGDEEWTEYDRMKKRSQQYARDYSGRALLNRERWAKFLGGRADYRSIARNIFKDTLWYRVKGYAFQTQQAIRGQQKAGLAEQDAHAQRYLQPLVDREASLLLVHSEGGTGLTRMRALFGSALVRLQREGRIELVIVPECDHLFTLLERQRRLSSIITQWATEHYALNGAADVAKVCNLYQR